MLGYLLRVNMLIVVTVSNVGTIIYLFENIDLSTFTKHTINIFCGFTMK